MKYFRINNQKYAVKIQRQNNHLPDLLMLHGFMGDHRVFDHLMEDLSSFCNPVTVDLLGFGSSSKPTDYRRYQENRQIEDILQLVEKLDSRSIFLFGYSMGGRLALKTALAATGIFGGVILESTTCGIQDPGKRKERKKTDAKWAKSIKNNFEQFLSQWKEMELFHAPIPVDQTLVARYQNIQSEQSPSALASSLRGFGTGVMTPSCEELKQLEIPVQLLAGSADTKYQQINSYMVDQFPNATFSSVKAGHRTHLDNPSLFVEKIKSFINGRG